MRPPHDSWNQGNDSGDYTAPVDKFLIHTTEGGSIAGAVAAYRANNSWPHLTVDCRFGRTYHITGHLDLNVPARALRNQTGGVQTNRDGVIQAEVVGSATNPGAIDWTWFGRNVVQPICAAKNIPVQSTVTWRAYPASYGAGSQRLSYAEWSAYKGILGHQHVPENSHGDPGAIPISTILAAAKPQGGFMADLTEEQQDEIYTKIRHIAASVVPHHQVNDARFRVQTLVGPLLAPAAEDAVNKAFVTSGSDVREQFAGSNEVESLVELALQRSESFSDLVAAVTALNDKVDELLAVDGG